VANGTIKRLVRDRGFGFIRDDGGQEWFFHRSSVQGSFDQFTGIWDVVTVANGAAPTLDAAARRLDEAFRRADEHATALVAELFALAEGTQDREAQNLYLDAQVWRATYVPASLRRYPFAMARMADPTQLAVMIDREWGGWSEVDGQPLFDVDGQPQPVLEQARKFLEQFETEAERTRLFCARLRDEDLLQDMRFDATLPDGKKLTVEGFLTIDEVKVAGLPDAKVVELHRNGMLGLIHMQQASLPLMRRLLEWRLARTAT